MRKMAHLAAFYANRRMLEGKWTPFIRVALQAGFFIGQGLRDQSRPGRHSPGWRESAVGVVAVAARHKPLVDAMLEGHREICANIAVAFVAEVGLSFREEKLRCG